MFEVSDAWKTACPEAHVGVLVMRDVVNPAHHDGLEAQKKQLEEQLRSEFSGQDRAALLRHPILQAYSAYYRRFDKTYHVQLQLESIVLKGKAIPSVAALVECMFMAEMKNFLLTAGHDLDALQLPAVLDVAKGTEAYMLLRGQEQLPKAGDMMISDRAGVISSIVYGPDQRTQINPNTRNVMFTVYAPPGITDAAVRQHLEDIRENVRLIAPESKVEMLEAFGAG